MPSGGCVVLKALSGLFLSPVGEQLGHSDRWMLDYSPVCVLGSTLYAGGGKVAARGSPGH